MIEKIVLLVGKITRPGARMSRFFLRKLMSQRRAALGLGDSTVDDPIPLREFAKFKRTSKAM